jgi:hypothetical protein
MAGLVHGHLACEARSRPAILAAVGRTAPGGRTVPPRKLLKNRSILPGTRLATPAPIVRLNLVATLPDGRPEPCGDDVMGIFGALTTAVTGMRAQSFALENVSGNIANSQTTAFKRSRQ